MAGVLEEVLAYLDAQGLGTAGTDLFHARLPKDPDACGAVYETGGIAPDLGFGSTAARFENPAIQVVFRGAPQDHDGPRAQAKTAWEKLAAVEAPQALSGTIYNWIRPLQQPFPLKKPDDTDPRWIIACNFLVEKEPTA
jgi:hypothetical protein